MPILHIDSFVGKGSRGVEEGLRGRNRVSDDHRGDSSLILLVDRWHQRYSSYGEYIYVRCFVKVVCNRV